MARKPNLFGSSILAPIEGAQINAAGATAAICESDDTALCRLAGLHSFKPQTRQRDLEHLNKLKF